MKNYLAALSLITFFVNDVSATTQVQSPPATPATANRCDRLSSRFVSSNALGGSVPGESYPQTYQEQQAQAVTLLTDDEARAFSRAASALASRAKVLMVVEATPFQPTLKELPSALPSGASVKELVPWLARAYDYTAEAQGNVWVLRKKYSDPADVPAVTLAECRQALSDIDRLMERYHPRLKVYPTPRYVYHGESQLYRKFWLSLSPKQLEKMHGAIQGTELVSPVPKEKALPVADLTTQQKQWLWQILLYWYMQGSQNAVSSTWQEIDDILKSGAAFLYHKPRTDDLFGYEVRNTFSNAFPNSILFWTINDHYLLGNNYFRNRRLPPPLWLSTPPARVEPGKPPVLVLPAWTARAKIPPPPADETIAWHDGLPPAATLGSVVAQLNRRSDTTAFEVDEMFARKPVTLFGQENAPPEALMRALGAVYDLRVVHLPDQPMRLVPPSLPAIKAFDDLPRLVWMRYPAPLRRAFRIEHADPEAEQKQFDDNEKAFQGILGNGKKSATDEDSARLTMIMRRRAGDPVETEEVGAAMGKFLHRTLKPRVDAAPDEMLLASELRPAEEAAFATLLMATTRRDCGEFFRIEAPRYLTEFDSFYICGALGLGRPENFSLTLAAPYPDGEHVGGGAPMYGGSIEPEYTGKL